MTVDLQAGISTNGKSLNPDSQHLSYVITAGPDDSSCAPSNTAPEVAADNPSVTVNEGDTAENTGTYFDADGDPVTFSASVGTVVNNGDGTWSWSFDTTDGPDDSQTVTITADDGEDTASVTFELTVNNVAPTVTLSGDASADEGQTKTYSYTIFDPGDDPNPTVTESCGDNGDYTDTLAANSFDCIFPDGPASSVVEVTADDGDPSNNVGSDSITVDVANVAPTIALTGASSVNEGSLYTLSLGAITDPGQDTVTAYSIDWGDGTTVEDFTGSPTGQSKTHTYADGPNDYTVTVALTDEDGTFTGGTKAVHVNNVAPSVAQPSFALTSINCQTSVSLTGISFSDPGVNDDDWTVVIDWGDGSTDTSYTTATQGPQPNQNHTYSTPGTFTATITVTDKDNGPGSNTSSNTVTVIQYAVDFLPPFDDSTPSGLIINKMKNGRVVPVKDTIYDHCAQAYVTDPSASVTIKVTKTSGTGTGDPVEEYADAGESSAGTNAFRWTTDSTAPGGGFWIYNLDSKALGLVVNNLYRVDAYVGLVKATVSNWAILQPVK